VENIKKDMTINDVIKAHPSTLGVFNSFGVDSCCGGARTLEDTAKEGAIDLDYFLKTLNEAAA